MNHKDFLRITFLTLFLAGFFLVPFAAWQHSVWGILICVILSLIIAILIIRDPFHLDEREPREGAIRDAQAEPATVAAPFPEAARSGSAIASRVAPIADAEPFTMPEGTFGGELDEYSLGAREDDRISRRMLDYASSSSDDIN